MNSKKFGLLDESIQTKFKENIVYDVPLNLLKPYSDNEFDLTEVEYLANDIKEYGQKTPVTVCIDTMQVVDGEQRYRALLLNNATTIKAIFKKYDDDLDRKISHYKANEHRKNIKPSTLANAIYDISLDLGKRGYNKSQIEEHLGSHYGYGDRTIRRYLVLHSLGDETKKKFDTGEYKIRDVDKVKKGELPNTIKKDSIEDLHITKAKNELSEIYHTKVDVKAKYVKFPVKNKEELENLLKLLGANIDS